MQDKAPKLNEGKFWYSLQQSIEYYIVKKKPRTIEGTNFRPIGLEARFIRQLVYWKEKGMGEERHGQHWVHITYDDWQKQLTITRPRLSRIVRNLLLLNLINIRNPYARDWDHTSYYAVNWDTARQLIADWQSKCIESDGNVTLPSLNSELSEGIRAEDATPLVTNCYHHNEHEYYSQSYYECDYAANVEETDLKRIRETLGSVCHDLEEPAIDYVNAIRQYCQDTKGSDIRWPVSWSLHVLRDVVSLIEEYDIDAVAYGLDEATRVLVEGKAKVVPGSNYIEQAASSFVLNPDRYDPSNKAYFRYLEKQAGMQC